MKRRSKIKQEKDRNGNLSKEIREEKIVQRKKKVWERSCVDMYMKEGNKLKKKKKVVNSAIV